MDNRKCDINIEKENPIFAQTKKFHRLKNMDIGQIFFSSLLSDQFVQEKKHQYLVDSIKSLTNILTDEKLSSITFVLVVDDD